MSIQPLKNRKRAYSYIRFSTPQQAMGNSLARQLKKSREYAALNDLDLDESLTFRDLGVSGYKGINLSKGALGAFFLAVQEGKIKSGSFLIVESLDRLSRSQILDQLDIFLGIVKAGIVIVTLADNHSYSKESIQNPHELIGSLVVMARAHDESRTKAMRLKAAWEEKRKRCSERKITARGPAWLTFDRDKKVFVENPERCRVVRQIFDWAKLGIGQEAISKRLNQAEIPVFGSGQSWHTSYVQKILKNRAVLGEFQPHQMSEGGKRVAAGEVSRTYFPRIISDELFYTVNAIRRANSKFAGRTGSSGVSNLFSGLVKCGYSGESMVFINKGQWRYLVSDRARRGKGGKYVSWEYKNFERVFLKFLTELDFAATGQDQESSKVLSLESQLSVERERKLILKSQQENLVESIASGCNGAPKILVEKLQSLEVEETQLNQRIQALEGELAEATQVQRVFEGNNEEFQRLLKLCDHAESRFSLRSEIRKRIELIEVYPEGCGRLESMLERMFNATPNSPEAFFGDDAKIFLKGFRSVEPSRYGKRGRLFKVFFKDGRGKIVCIHPDDLEDFLYVVGGMGKAGEKVRFPQGLEPSEDDEVIGKIATFIENRSSD